MGRGSKEAALPRNHPQHHLQVPRRASVHHRVWWLLLVVLVLSAPTQSALAQSPIAQDKVDERARELYENGAILYEEGRYEDAIYAWQKAYELSGRALFLYNIANAQERIGRWQDALDSLNRFRAFAAADERDTLDRRIRNIERRLKDQEPFRQSGPVEARPPTNPQDTGRLDQNRSRGSSRSSSALSRPHPGPLVMIAGGLTGVAAGGVFAALANSAGKNAAALCAARQDGRVLCPQTASALLSQQRSHALGADLGIGAGSLVATTGIILTIVDAAKRGQGPRAAVRLLPTGGPHDAGLLLTGEF